MHPSLANPLTTSSICRLCRHQPPQTRLRHHGHLAHQPAITFAHTIHLASCTKLLTTICALQCLEQGLISLDAFPRRPPPRALHPQTRHHAPTDPDRPPFSTARRTRALTLRHLLAHTSGCTHDALSPALAA
ncbi:hypothetical protein B0J12DRAFT_700916 [Macrophomina phaseolina]|uniref:Beta-lactamase-related domain-containing protein n=1 Tax=Macrophomina phaseolina TaxID=35725 RepID=A0ABQ8G843_9PEZI|nr:hypothetical protein B0J12DRAFT_700916 [Macrophomina phaseolina]